MSETNTPVTESTESTTESAPSENTEIQADQASEGSAPSGDTYEDRIEQILKQKEADDKGVELEKESLREGESWSDNYNRQDPEVQRAMQSLRKDYTHKTQEISKQKKEAKSEK